MKKRLIKPTPAEDAAINAGIAADPDTVEWTQEDFAKAFAEKRGRGRPLGSVAAVTKKQVTMRLDPDVLDAVKASGRGWHSRVNDALRASFVTGKQR